MHKLLALSVCLFTLLAISNRSVAQESMKTDQMMQQSLYERLGGEAAIKAVVDDVVTRAAADTRINAKFARTDIPRLKFNLVKQICAVTGGPCKDLGRPPERIHKDLKITSGEFDAFVEDLTATLNKLNVASKEQGELLGILGSLKSKVVEVPDSAATGTPLPTDFKPAKPLAPAQMSEDKLMDKKKGDMKKP